MFLKSYQKLFKNKYLVPKYAVLLKIGTGIYLF